MDSIYWMRVSTGESRPERSRESGSFVGVLSLATVLITLPLCLLRYIWNGLALLYLWFFAMWAVLSWWKLLFRA